MKGLLSAPLSSRKLVEYLLLFLLLASVLSAAAYGGYWYGKQQVTSPQTMVPKAKEPPSQKAADETAGWKTYKNESYGFELKYPENFFVHSGLSSYKVSLEKVPVIPFLTLANEAYRDLGQFPQITFSLVSTPREVVAFIQSESTRLLQEWRRFRKESGAQYSDSQDPRLTSIGDYQVGSLEVKKVVRVGPPNQPNTDFTEFYFKRGEVVYILSATGTEEEKIMSNILSTFRFLDQE